MSSFWLCLLKAFTAWLAVGLENRRPQVVEELDVLAARLVRLVTEAQQLLTAQQRQDSTRCQGRLPARRALLAILAPLLLYQLSVRLAAPQLLELLHVPLSQLET